MKLFGKSIRVAGELKGFECEDCGGRMVTVSIAGFGGETRDEHIGLEFTDDPHDIGEHLLAVPDAEGLAVILSQNA